MEIEDSSLWREVETILNSGDKKTYFSWDGIIHANSVDIDIFRLVGIDNTRNYESQVGDGMSLMTMIPLGTYAKKVYPYRDRLEITLKRTTLIGYGQDVDENAVVESTRYKASLILDDIPNIEGAEINRLSEDILNLRQILDISFQLVDRSMEQLRSVIVGGSFRNTAAASVIRAVLTAESAKVKIDGEPSIGGVELTPPDNKDVKEHVVIPQGTNLLNLATYIQEKCGGIYRGGMGTYLQDKMWYVYPLFDTSKLSASEATTTIIKVTGPKAQGFDRTHREEGRSVFIVATSDGEFSDDGGTKAFSDGAGVRLANADNFMGELTKNAGNKAVMSRGKNNTEFTTQAPAEGQVQYIPVSKDRISSNPYNDYARIMSRLGGLYTFKWEAADPSLLFPGMMARILFLDGDDVKELHGVLLFVHTSTTLMGKGATAGKFTTTCSITFYARKPDSADATI
jgi:hypothetical protein